MHMPQASGPRRSACSSVYLSSSPQRPAQPTTTTTAAVVAGRRVDLLRYTTPSSPTDARYPVQLSGRTCADTHTCERSPETRPLSREEGWSWTRSLQFTPDTSPRARLPRLNVLDRPPAPNGVLSCIRRYATVARWNHGDSHAGQVRAHSRSFILQQERRGASDLFAGSI